MYIHTCSVFFHARAKPSRTPALPAWEVSSVDCSNICQCDVSLPQSWPAPPQAWHLNFVCFLKLSKLDPQFQFCSRKCIRVGIWPTSPGWPRIPNAGLPPAPNLPFTNDNVRHTLCQARLLLNPVNGHQPPTVAVFVSSIHQRTECPPANTCLLFLCYCNSMLSSCLWM